MKALLFYLFLPLIYLLSLLPFRLLYLLSDLLTFILYRLMAYRRQIIAQNIQNSFPEKSPEERQKIAADFYRHFCDIWLETVKMLTIGRKTLLKRCHFADLSVSEKYYQKGQSIIFIMGHFGNWEWGNYAMRLSSDYPFYAVYKKLQNPYFDGLMYKIRSKFGTIPVSSNNILRIILKSKETCSAIGLIADQTPMPEYAYWTYFLNQATPVFRGTARIARKMNYPLLFASIRKQKRGYYKIHLEELFSQPKDVSEDEITRRHTAFLEDEIRKLPHTWLWSHKRWKHKPPPNLPISG